MCTRQRGACCCSLLLPAARATHPLTRKPADTIQGRALGGFVRSICDSGGSQYNWTRWGHEKRNRKAERWWTLLWIKQQAWGTTGKSLQAA